MPKLEITTPPFLTLTNLSTGNGIMIPTARIKLIHDDVKRRTLILSDGDHGDDIVYVSETFDQIKIQFPMAAVSEEYTRECEHFNENFVQVLLPIGHFPKHSKVRISKE